MGNIKNIEVVKVSDQPTVDNLNGFFAFGIDSEGNNRKAALGIVQEKINAAQTATDNANNAATEARQAKSDANNAAQAAQTATDNANNAATNARHAGSVANNAAEAANDAAREANDAALAANDAALAVLAAAEEAGLIIPPKVQ